MGEFFFFYPVLHKSSNVLCYLGDFICSASLTVHDVSIASSPGFPYRLCIHGRVKPEEVGDKTKSSEEGGSGTKLRAQRREGRGQN